MVGQGSIVKNYEIIKQLGKGKYSTVYKVEHRKELKATYALKMMQLGNDAGFNKEVAREIVSMHENINHPNIVCLKETFVYHERLRNKTIIDYICIVMELVDKDLVKAKSQGLMKDAAKLKETMRQILKGAEALHSTNTIHRDIHPGNILLNDEGAVVEVKLTDFGLSRNVYDGVKVTPMVGDNNKYCAPEKLLGDAYGKPADIWSIGCVLLFLVLPNKDFPFNDIDDDDLNLNAKKGMLVSIFRKLGTPSEEVWPGVEELPNFPPLDACSSTTTTFEVAGLCEEGNKLLRGLLEVVPGRRLTATQALQHDYFTEHESDSS